MCWRPRPPRRWRRALARRKRARCPLGPSPATGETLPIIGLGSTRPVTAIAERGPGPVEAVVRTLVEHGGRVVDTWPRSEANDGAFGRDHQRARFARAPVRHDQPRAARRAGRARAFRAHAAPLPARAHRSRQRRQPHRPRRAMAEPARVQGRRRRRATSASRPRRPRSTGSSKRFSSASGRTSSRSTTRSPSATPSGACCRCCADRGIAVLISRPFMNGAYFERLANVPLPDWAAEFECDELGAVLAAIHPREPGRHLRADRDDERRAHGRERARGVRAGAERGGARRGCAAFIDAA